MMRFIQSRFGFRNKKNINLKEPGFGHLMVSLMILGVALFARQNLLASDHVDEHVGYELAKAGPFAGSEQSTARDLTDLFSWVNKKGKLVIVLNANLAAQPSTRFDDAVTYDLIVKPVRLVNASHAPSASDDDAVQSPRLQIPVLNNGKNGGSDFELRISCKYSHVAAPKKQSVYPVKLFSKWAAKEKVNSHAKKTLNLVSCVTKNKENGVFRSVGHLVETHFNSSSKINKTFEYANPSLPFYRVRAGKVVGDVLATKMQLLGGKAKQPALRLYAGLRADPFILSLGWAGKTLGTGGKDQIPTLAKYDLATAKSDLNTFNVLSLVLELDVNQLLGTANQNFAVAAEVLPVAGDVNPITRWDRVGRPEITNMTIRKKEVFPEDGSPRTPGIKQVYNLQDTFGLGGFTPTVNYILKLGVRFWDSTASLSGSGKDLEWGEQEILPPGVVRPPEQHKPQLLDDFVHILTNDYLVVNARNQCPFYKLGADAIAKPKSVTGELAAANATELTENEKAAEKARLYANKYSTYLGLELAQFKHGQNLAPDKLCGGRMPNDDVIDAMVSVYVGGPSAPASAFGDGAYHNAKSASKEWPFLAAPNLPVGR